MNKIVRDLARHCRILKLTEIKETSTMVLTRKKITKAQKAKVAKMAEYLKTETGATQGIKIETGVTTHLEFFTACFQNITGFYLIQGDGGAGDKLKISDIHYIYQAALKDKDFKAFVAGDTVKTGPQGSSKAPADGPPVLKGQNTAPGKESDKTSVDGLNVTIEEGK
jgi:hypothetical protein